MVIGITGSFGAGKGAAVEFLVNEKNFIHYSVSGFITEEIIRRQLPVNRDSMIIVANDMRAKYGPSYFIDTLYARAKEDRGDVVIESLRAVAEVKRLKELGGLVIGIDADSVVRYERSAARGSLKDGVSFEKWSSQEKEESNTDDETKQNIFGALKESDFIIKNNGTIKELHAQVNVFIKNFGNK